MGINKQGFQNMNETLKLALEGDPLNTLTWVELKEWIHEDANELQNNSMVEMICIESNSSDNGE